MPRCSRCRLRQEGAAAAAAAAGARAPSTDCPGAPRRRGQLQFTLPPRNARTAPGRSTRPRRGLRRHGGAGASPPPNRDADPADAPVGASRSSRRRPRATTSRTTLSDTRPRRRRAARLEALTPATLTPRCRTGRRAESPSRRRCRRRLDAAAGAAGRRRRRAACAVAGASPRVRRRPRVCRPRRPRAAARVPPAASPVAGSASHRPARRRRAPPPRVAGARRRARAAPPRSTAADPVASAAVDRGAPPPGAPPAASRPATPPTPLNAAPVPTATFERDRRRRSGPSGATSCARSLTSGNVARERGVAAGLRDAARHVPAGGAAGLDAVGQRRRGELIWDANPGAGPRRLHRLARRGPGDDTAAADAEAPITRDDLSRRHRAPGVRYVYAVVAVDARRAT